VTCVVPPVSVQRLVTSEKSYQATQLGTNNGLDVMVVPELVAADHGWSLSPRRGVTSNASTFRVTATNNMIA
jgi:hypothetical protein